MADKSDTAAVAADAAPADSWSAARAGAARGDRYMPQLDVLRAFAVLFVILYHWCAQNALVRGLSLGPTGVTVFFVLSGFLITRILLESRNEAEQSGLGRGGVLGRFYARRTLRIFPVYYLTLLALFVAGIPGLRENIWWFLLHASNILLYQTQAWLPYTSHFWTLAVEEQFYLLWPVLILFTPRRHLLKLILMAVLAGPLSRLWLLQIWDGSAVGLDMVVVLMPTCMDCLGLGALLAYQRTYVDERFLFRSWTWWLLLALSAGCLLWFRDSVYHLGSVLSRFFVSVLALELIARASLGFAGRARLLMENPVLVYLGRISYGLYLFHLPLPLLYNWLGLPSFESAIAVFAAKFCLLVLLAAASWHLFEKPINGLKRFFTSPPEARTKVPAVVKYAP